MKLHIFFLTLLLLPSVLAAGLSSDYLIVAETTRDVVAGANFAASVNQFATFSAVLMEDLQTLSDSELSQKYIVIIQDDQAVFLGRDDYSSVFERYFREREYELSYSSLPRQADLRFPNEPEVVEQEEPEVIEPEEVVEELQEQIEEVIIVEPEVYVCDGCDLDGECHALGKHFDIDETEHECTAEGFIPVEKPNIIERILSWFAHLF